MWDASLHSRHEGLKHLPRNYMVAWFPSRLVHFFTSCWGLADVYEGVSISFRTGRLERELQTVQLSATRCSCIAILWVSLGSFAAITLRVASQRVLIVPVYFVMDSVRKLLDTPSHLWILSIFICLQKFILRDWIWTLWTCDTHSLLLSRGHIAKLPFAGRTVGTWSSNRIDVVISRNTGTNSAEIIEWSF
jgi:hypothetical protein